MSAAGPLLNHTLGLGECATLACLLEVSAAKPGNVHRGADFEDLTFTDFVLSAQALGRVFQQAEDLPLGQLVLDAVRATRSWVATNTNLGLILLLAPLAKVRPGETWEAGIARVLGATTSQDARDVYEAIRVAQPGGLGAAPQADVADDAPSNLIDAMRLAAERDLIARQYAHDFAEVLHSVAPGLREGLARGRSVQTTIIHTFVRLMHEHPDTLIARKCGREIAEQSARYAGVVLGAGEPDSETYEDALADLDFWLRADGHRRNPGTSADLLGAGLFALLREGTLAPPWRFYSAGHSA